ncbi:hypothetical protein, partial [Rosistilla oblonga]|uniref:hypothetical protein n=1 Tax=Rosistilla oblonga TaxID=2527990 RepID=UPI003A96FE14
LAFFISRHSRKPRFLREINASQRCPTGAHILNAQTRPANHANTVNDIIDSQTELKTKHLNEPRIPIRSPQPSVPSELSVAKTSICDPSETIAHRGPRVPEVRRCATTPGYLLASLREHRVQHTCRTMNTNENGVAIEVTDTEPAIH